MPCHLTTCHLTSQKRSKVPRHPANHEHTSRTHVPAGRWHAWVRFGARTHTANSEHTSGALGESSSKVQQASTHASHIHVHVGVGQRSRARDGEPPALLPTISTHHVPAGRWESSRRVQQASAQSQSQPDYCTRWCRSALPCPRYGVPRHDPANHERTSFFQRGDGTLHKGEHAPNLQCWSRCLSWSELPCRQP